MSESRNLNIIYVGDVAIEGNLTLLNGTLRSASTDQSTDDKEYIREAEYDYYFTGSGNNAVVALPANKPAVIGSMRLLANADPFSAGTKEWLRKTANNEGTTLWQYEEEISDGIVTGLIPRTVFDETVQFAVFYRVSPSYD